MAALHTSMWPGADLSSVGVVTGTDPANLPLPELGQALHAAKHGQAFLDWQQFQYALATFAAVEANQRDTAAVRTNLLDVYAQTVLEVQVALESTEHAAHALLDDAFAARDRLPQVADLLRLGRIDRRRFHRIILETDLVTDPARIAVLDTTIAAHLLGMGSATSLSEAKTSALARRFVAQADPDAVRDRRENAKKRRAVSYRVLEDGLGQVTVVVTAEDMRLMNQTVDAVVAGRCNDDPRTKDQARADAMRALILRTQFVCQCESLQCTAQIRSAQIDARLTRILIHVLADSSTLDGGDTCGYIDGYGPISADHVREIAARDDAAIRQHDLSDLFDAQPDTATDTDESTVHRQPPRPDTPGESGGDTPYPPAPTEPPSWLDEPPASPAEPPASLVEPGRSASDDPCRNHAHTANLDVYTAPAATLATLDPARGEHIPLGPPPAWLDDWDAALAALTSQTTAERVITHTALPSDDYRPTALTNVIARFLWGTCSVLGCERAAFSCDLDHVAEYGPGPTCLCNLIPKCRFHHLVKTNLEGFVDELWIDADGQYHSAMTTPGGLTVELLAPNQWLLPQLTGLRCTHQLADHRATSTATGARTEAPQRARPRTEAKHARRRAERKANAALRAELDAKRDADLAAAEQHYLERLGDPPF
ncbi:MAG: DUF222 domain-containing protein [Gordonia sp. (in: high G+C Gram-positive bacteria)]|uniref:DUF222 domain-containing protein n=1 Tax=Gordonia sp. (in: high G+C Gram-positive bacteria) TaxID=84139 RepID=UPI003BB6379C